MEAGSKRPGKLNTMVYILFGLQILFSHIGSGFYNFIAYIDNNQDASGGMIGLLSVVAMLAAAGAVVWSGRRHSPVLMYLSVEAIFIMYRLLINPLQILRPFNLIYTVFVITFAILFLKKLPQDRVKDTDEQESSKAFAKFRLILLYLLAAVPVLYSIYSKYGDYESMLTFGKYLKLSYFFVLLNAIYLFLSNTYLRVRLKEILTFIIVYNISIFVLPLLFYLPVINSFALYVWYYKVYALLALLIIALLYALVPGRRWSLLARLSDRIYI